LSIILLTSLVVFAFGEEYSFSQSESQSLDSFTFNFESELEKRKAKKKVVKAPKKSTPKKAAPKKAAPKKEGAKKEAGEKKISPVKLGKKPPVRKGKGAPDKVSTAAKFAGVAVVEGKENAANDPNLQEAVKAREGFNRLTIHELAIMASPPPAVGDVGKALGCALGIPVTNWAEGKSIIKDPKLISVLEKFDYDKNECKGLDKAVASFDVAALAKSSKAAAALAQWLIAVSKYKASKSSGTTAPATT